MGYNHAEINIGLRLDNHLGPETERDKQEARNLAAEIAALCKKPQYARLTHSGTTIMGPGV